MAADAPPALLIDHVSKSFGRTWVLDRFSLAVQPGEFVSLLGPSGCGKTTLLRMISGFLDPDQGDILVRGASIRGVPPNRRNLGMVFQGYSLWPHLTVGRNVGFGLAMRGVPRRERPERIRHALALVGLDDYAERLPGALSGGQRQRVAIARAVVYEPDILLLDEPLSALDRKLRERMQTDLRALQQRLGITTILVTHDQDEALQISDRIAVMQSGRLLQEGAPEDIYKHPRSGFVADFVGRMNSLEARVETQADGTSVLRTADGLVFAAPIDRALAPGALVRAIIRPERIALSASPRPRAIEAVIESVTFLGALAYFDCRLAGGRRLTAAELQTDDRASARTGSVWLDWADHDLRVLDDVPSETPTQERGSLS